MRNEILIGLVALVGIGVARLKADDQPVQFAAEPRVALDGAAVKIKFAVSRATDLAVEILDEKGDTVRHLAAGLLGPNAPEPLKADSLTQTLTWDRKDDLGKDAPAGNYSVRVGLGLKPSLKKVENFSALAVGSPLGLAALPDGGTVVAGAMYNCVPRYVIVDRDGKAARQLYPPPADLKPEDSPGLPFFQRGDGRWVPILDYGLPSVATHTAMAAAAGKLFLCPDNGGAPRVINLKTCGLVKPLADPLFGSGKGKLCIRGAAASPDGKFLYLAGIELGTYGAFDVPHAVYRIPTDGSARAKVFFGTPTTAANTETHLNKPLGLATDKEGNLYVADNGNNRVAVIGPDGAFRRAIATAAPLYIQVHPRTSDLYVLGGQQIVGTTKGGGDVRSLGWKGRGLIVGKWPADGRAPTTQPVPRPLEYAYYTGLALDAVQEPAVLCVSSKGWAGAGRVDRYEDREAGLTAVAAVWTGAHKGVGASPNGYDPRYVNNTPNYPPYTDAVDYHYFADEGTPFFSMSPNAKGLWADGNMYTRTNWADPGGLQRLKADKSACPFEALGSNVLNTTTRPASPWFPNRGTLVDRRGHIYLRYTYVNQQKAAAVGKDGGMTTGIEHFGADGKSLGMVHLSNSTYGIGVDVRGNLYVGDKPRPPGVMVPADIEKAFNGKVPQSIINAYGCVLKFGPEGGGYVWKRGKAAGTTQREEGDLWKTPPTGLDALDNYNRTYTTDLQGAKWMWLGMSFVPTYYSCICYGNEMAVDPHGRIFVPDKVACRVAVLDTNGNLIRYIGAYGNVDSRGRGSRVPDPEIAFASIRMVIPTATSRQFRVADNGNSWVSVINLGYEAETRTAVSLK